MIQQKKKKALSSGSALTLSVTLGGSFPSPRLRFPKREALAPALPDGGTHQAGPGRRVSG